MKRPDEIPLPVETVRIDGRDAGVAPLIGIQAQIKCVEREIGFRIRVYARRVNDGKMTLMQSNDEIALMRAVLETLRQVEKRERLI